jgi:hypothetical protein
MALMLQAALNSSRDIMTSPMASTKPVRIPRCIFCDSTEHAQRSQCPNFADALCRKHVYLNERNHVVNAATHKEMRPMFGNGGMKRALDQFLAARVSVSSNVITLDTPYGSIGNRNSVRMTTIRADGTVEQEIIEAEVNEKRRRGDIHDTRNVRCRMEEISTQDTPTSNETSTVNDAPMSNNTPTKPRRPTKCRCATIHQ